MNKSINLEYCLAKGHHLHSGNEIFMIVLTSFRFLLETPMNEVCLIQILVREQVGEKRSTVGTQQNVCMLSITRAF